MDKNCGMCQRSVSSADYIPVEAVEDGMVWCNENQRFCSAEDGDVCEKYVPSRR